MKHSDTRIGLRDAVDGFLFSLRAEGRADRTIEYYDDLLRCSLQYAEDNKWPDSIQTVDARQLRQFLSWVGSRTFEHNAGNGSHLVRKAKSSTAWPYYKALRRLFNWLVLMKSIPKGEDLYLLTDDKDYMSKLDSNKLCDYLKTEWEEKQESSIHIYRKLSEFLREKYPDIKLASELEKQLAIDALINSPNFASTHLAIKNLSKYSDFSDSEVNEIARAAVQNRQIYWIMEDPDVESFLSQIFEGREDIISPDIFKEYREISSSVKEESSEEGDIPF